MTQMIQWKISIVPAPMPTDEVIASRGGHGNMLADVWRRVVLPHAGDVSADADYEDWAEQAARLDAGLRLLPDDTLVAIRSTRIRNPLDRAGHEVDASALNGRAQWGVVSDVPRCDDAYAEPVTPADAYAQIPAVLARLNRDYNVVHADIDAVKETVGDMLVSHESVWIKNVLRAKRGLVRDVRDVVQLESTVGNDDMGGNAEQWDMLCWDLIRREGDPTAVLVQAGADIRHEMRFFVVDGKPVVGAGNVEALTPAQSRGLVVDPRAEEVRGSGIVVSDVNIVEQLHAFATSAAADIVADARHMDVRGWARPFVLDVAMINGAPGIVELNGVQNAGLYALDVDKLLTALLATENPPVPPSMGDFWRQVR